MNGGVLFPRGTSHDLHAAIENLLARHDELGLAAAKEHREHLAKTAIHGIERALQQGPRFAVDTADRVLEGLQGGGEVRGLGIEKLLAFLARRQLIERRHVDRAELGDHIGEARDLALQRRRSLAFFQHRRQGRFIRAGLAKLLCELLARDSRRLLLQPRFRDAVAQGLELLLAGESLLLGGAQPAGDFFLAVARPCQGLLPSDPRRQPLLKLGPQHLVVHAGQLDLELFEASFGILHMLQYNFRRSFYLTDFTYTILFRITCLLKLTLRLHHGLALRFQLEFRSVPVFLGGFELAVERVDLALTPLEACLRSRLGSMLLGLLGGNFSEFPVDLPAALLVALLPLSQLEVFQLMLVVALFEG